MSRIMSCALVAMLTFGACTGPSDDADVGVTADTAETDGEGPDAAPPPLDLVALADPFVGSGGLWFHVGSDSPAAMTPFGLASVGPDTTQAGGAAGANHCSGYHADDALVLGFSHVRAQGVGIPDAGHVRFVPARGPMTTAKTTPQGYRGTLDRASETAHPGFYGVRLTEPDVQVELAATPRTGAHRYTWGAGASGAPLLLVDLGRGAAGAVASDAQITIDAAARELRGFTTIAGQFSGGATVWFVARFDTPFASAGTWSDAGVSNARDATGAAIGAWLAFAPDVTAVQARVGLSFVDADGARGNLAAELPDGGLDDVRAAAEQAWAEQLASIRAWGGDPSSQVKLASALYHVLLMPTLFTDADGRYRGLDGAVHAVEGFGTAAGFTYHTNFSLWDTWRTLHPLVTLLWPARQHDFVTSLLTMAEQAGALPRWPLWDRETNCMIGSHADVVLADSALKGVAPDDVEAAWSAITAIADAPTPPGCSVDGRGQGVLDYVSLGYLAADRDGAATSRTLEYAAEDAGIANLAAAWGKPADAERYAARAQSYRNVFEPTTRFFRGRNADGTWAEPFDEADWHEYYTEGNARQYRWLVPHDPAGLIELLGGSEAAVDDLTTFLQAGLDQWEAYTRLGIPAPVWYWQGNEPDLHAAYLLNDAGRPDLAQRWVRTIADVMYGTGRDGLAGNDDAGTLSAWYVFAAIGLYPVTGSDRYWLGSPIFQRVELDLPVGKLVIEAPDASPSNVYVTRVTLDGQPLTGPYVTHGQLVGGHTLRFEQAAAPTSRAR
jgi:predicted alpha-1,2-mannosidase